MKIISVKFCGVLGGQSKGRVRCGEVEKFVPEFSFGCQVLTFLLELSNR